MMWYMYVCMYVCISITLETIEMLFRGILIMGLFFGRPHDKVIPSVMTVTTRVPPIAVAADRFIPPFYKEEREEEDYERLREKDWEIARNKMRVRDK